LFTATCASTKRVMGFSFCFGEMAVWENLPGKYKEGSQVSKRPGG